MSTDRDFLALAPSKKGSLMNQSKAEVTLLDPRKSSASVISRSKLFQLINQGPWEIAVSYLLSDTDNIQDPAKKKFVDSLDFLVKSSFEDLDDFSEDWKKVRSQVYQCLQNFCWFGEKAKEFDELVEPALYSKLLDFVYEVDRHHELVRPGLVDKLQGNFICQYIKGFN